MENWKDIQDYEGRYQVSDLGRVQTLPHYIPHNLFNGVMKFVRGRMRVPQNHSQGYLFIVLTKGDQRLIHRLVAEAFHDKPIGKNFVNHKNGNKKDNRADNVEWCTRQENETHAFGTGLKNSTGSHNTMAKLTEDKVREIKSLIKVKGSDELAEMFGVHGVTISRIRNGKIWKHVA